MFDDIACGSWEGLAWLVFQPSACSALITKCRFNRHFVTGVDYTIIFVTLTPFNLLRRQMAWFQNIGVDSKRQAVTPEPDGPFVLKQS